MYTFTALKNFTSKSQSLFSHQCFTKVYMVVLNLKECRRSNLWNPDIYPYSWNPQQAPWCFQLGGIPGEDTETEIPSGCSLQAHCYLLGQNRFGLSEDGEGKLWPFFLPSQLWKKELLHTTSMCCYETQDKEFAKGSLWILFLLWLERYVIGTSLWQIALLTLLKHL